MSVSWSDADVEGVKAYFCRTDDFDTSIYLCGTYDYTTPTDVVGSSGYFTGSEPQYTPEEAIDDDTGDAWIESSSQSDTDYENSHCEADQLLLDFINDDRVEEAFSELHKWYA